MRASLPTRTARGLAATSLLVALAGCRPPPPPTRPLTDGRDALVLHGSLRAAVRSVHAVARVEQRGERGRVRGTVYMLLALPVEMRFDVMSPFGPVATLTAAHGAFALLDQREGRFLQGPACAANVQRFLGVALAPEEVVTLMMGGVPVDPSVPSRIETRPGGYHVVVDDPRGRIDADFRVRAQDLDAPPTEQHLRLVRLVVRTPTGRTRLVLSYEDYRVVEDPNDPSDPQHGVALPHVVRIEDRVADTAIEVRFRELSLNGELDPIAFEQAVPTGMAAEYAGCD